MEFEFSKEHEHSVRLKEWYEGKLGFKCDSARRNWNGEFRRCRKKVCPLESVLGQRQRLQHVLELVRAGAVDVGGSESEDQESREDEEEDEEEEDGSMGEEQAAPKRRSVCATS
eukprot:TRINITY_DN2329_c0_g1_i2.p2 TRINITY_DN2329_c0_g1~~TRINITY_DN2329_c0_g1_i2.p2  ORF type:complete len:114 (-),score=31.05 TRINITY_DN2329_c0_g1_i2:112-453(-)